MRHRLWSRPKVRRCGWNRRKLGAKRERQTEQRTLQVEVRQRLARRHDPRRTRKRMHQLPQRLLDFQDPDLYDMCLGRASPPDGALTTLIERMTATRSNDL